MPQQSSLFNLTQDFGDDISEMHSSSVASDLDLAMDESMKANVPSCEMPETDMVGKSVFIGWSMMPRLFEIWDFDESGYIDRDELLFGVNEYCVRNNVTVPNKVLIEMMDEVDTNHDHQLDIHEFSVFLHKFVEFVGCPLDDATYFLLEILDSQRSAGKLACSKKTNFLSLVHLMKNAFKTPLRKSVSSVSTTGTTTSEGSAGEMEDALLEDFRHERRRKRLRKVMLLVKMKSAKIPGFNSDIANEPCDPTIDSPEELKFGLSHISPPSDMQKLNFSGDELSDSLHTDAGSVLTLLALGGSGGWSCSSP